MSAAIAITKRELRTYFNSPVAYIVVTVYMLLAGYLYFNHVFIEKQAEMRAYFGLAPMLFSFLIPAMTMRLLVESDLSPASGIVGVGFEEFRWPNPTRPDDVLHLDIEVLEVRPSKSRPDQGVIKVRTATLNQNNEPVQVSVGNLIVRRRPASTG